MSESVDGNADLSTLRTIADYQFGAGAGTALFPDMSSSDASADELTIKRTSSGRPQQVHAEAGRIVSFGIDGQFTLGLEGGRRLAAVLESPAYRVVVDDESEPFVRDEKNVFTKFVVDVGEEIRPGDEVLVVHERGELLAVGRAELDAASIADFETGMAVNVREGAPAPE
ncbi:PUA domain-containing protein [Natrialba chahannaoensis JCM 10990]|uniref:PUA domain-containing protein n=1 Tax=Natrialba chahannaoensis JCM 10990 TaxID=1227492 RepID=M0A780_9EURY|nr:PUA domain-containing protein [Natrialba chahannaoensis]ELY93193.1 PUA domain-containing protein [Natrialba chahannaoensis JCM 10990]